MSSAIPPSSFVETQVQTAFGSLHWLGAASFAVRYQPSGHDPTLKLVLATDGRARVRQDGRESLLDAGQFAWLDARRPFTLESSGGRQFQIRLPLPVVLARYPNLDTESSFHSPHGTASTRVMTALLRGLAAEGASLDPSASASALAAVLEAVGMGPRRSPGTGVGSQVALACDMISAALHEPTLRSEVIAAAVGVSRRHLDARFREATGHSVTGYIRELRLQRAACELRDLPARTVTEIAHRWGFVDSSHFTRRFQARFHTTPTRYKGTRTLVGARARGRPGA